MTIIPCEIKLFEWKKMLTAEDNSQGVLGATIQIVTNVSSKLPNEAIKRLTGTSNECSCSSIRFALKGNIHAKAVNIV